VSTACSRTLNSQTKNSSQKTATALEESWENTQQLTHTWLEWFLIPATAQLITRPSTVRLRLRVVRKLKTNPQGCWFWTVLTPVTHLLLDAVQGTWSAVYCKQLTGHQLVDLWCIRCCQLRNRCARRRDRSPTVLITSSAFVSAPMCPLSPLTVFTFLLAVASRCVKRWLITTCAYLAVAVSLLNASVHAYKVYVLCP